MLTFTVKFLFLLVPSISVTLTLTVYVPVEDGLKLAEVDVVSAFPMVVHFVAVLFLYEYVYLHLPSA